MLKPMFFILILNGLSFSLLYSYINYIKQSSQDEISSLVQKINKLEEQMKELESTKTALQDFINTEYHIVS